MCVCTYIYIRVARVVVLQDARMAGRGGGGGGHATGPTRESVDISALVGRSALSGAGEAGKGTGERGVGERVRERSFIHNQEVT